MPTGLFNSIIMLFGGKSIDFLARFDTVLPAVAAVEGWQYIGIYMIIFYSALISISDEIIEAARIDGAREFQILCRIRIPNIKNVIGLSLILSIVGALRGFASIMNLTKGGPSNRSEILSTYLYKTAFTNMKIGYGSAIAVVIMAISLICVYAVNRSTSMRD
ncbi:putative multiple-sugar transport system permease YteP [bioreactor metagenome]|uniref:Putative multiple-sugar transport system permease YteP n=1 Tax=bioreactor metagenome TaxID=1076179 RepID=A0A645GX42_9ZZZZ